MRLVVGRVARAHGVRGELSVESRTDEPARRFAVGSELWCDGRRLEITGGRRHQERWLLTVDAVSDRTAAEALAGRLLEAEIDDAAPADDADEFYDHQLVGLAVRSGGREVGRVVEVRHLPAQDLLVLDVDGTEVLVPFVGELVPTVDVAAGYVDVADRPGLLDPEAAEEVR